MLVNTQRDTDIVSVSNRTEPEEEKESWTREKALERNKQQQRSRYNNAYDGFHHNFAPPVSVCRILNFSPFC